MCVCLCTQVDLIEKAVHSKDEVCECVLGGGVGGGADRGGGGGGAV